EIQDGGIFGILVAAQVHFHVEDAGGLEAGTDLNQMIEAFEHQASADEENQSERGFGDGERAAQTMLCRSGGCAAAAFFQSRLQIRAGGLQRRDESESESYQNDDDGGEEEDARVHAHAHRLK